MKDQIKTNIPQLDNQLCFPLYAAARKMIAAYNPLLKDLGLTYPQYITMMVLWQVKEISMHDLGKRLFLDSGTLTPVLKRLESSGYLSRSRCKEDERVLMISLTEEGFKLSEKAEQLPYQMRCLLNCNGELFTPEEVTTLKKQLYQIIHTLE